MVLGEGVLGWVYEYSNLKAVHKGDALATGLELGVQLRGDWTQAGSRTGFELAVLLRGRSGAGGEEGNDEEGEQKASEVHAVRATTAHETDNWTKNTPPARRR